MSSGWVASDGGNSCSPLARPASRIPFSRIQRSHSRGLYFRSAWLHPGTIVQSSATENLFLIFTPAALVRFRSKHLPADSCPPPSEAGETTESTRTHGRSGLPGLRPRWQWVASSGRFYSGISPSMAHSVSPRGLDGPARAPACAKASPAGEPPRPPWHRLTGRSDRDEAILESRLAASEEVGT